MANTQDRVVSITLTREQFADTIQGYLSEGETLRLTDEQWAELADDIEGRGGNNFDAMLEDIAKDVIEDDQYDITPAGEED